MKPRALRNQLAEYFIRGFQAGAERPQDAGDGDAMYQAFRDYHDHPEAERIAEEAPPAEAKEALGHMEAAERLATGAAALLRAAGSACFCESKTYCWPCTIRDALGESVSEPLAQVDALWDTAPATPP